MQRKLSCGGKQLAALKNAAQPLSPEDELHTLHARQGDDAGG